MIHAWVWDLLQSDFDVPSVQTCSAQLQQAVSTVETDQHGPFQTISHLSEDHQNTFTLINKLLQASLYQLVFSQPIDGKSSKTCQYKNNGVTYQINEGEVSEIKKSKVRVCLDGKNVLKKKAEVPLPWKYACNGCTVKGKVVCQGTVVRVRKYLRLKNILW